ncbi:periplasmic heavy metal sensor [Chitinasiproducens palmae]|uniref:Heavy-metal resistance n=1 Tax=Chitinasiproducens palmae TaxID=1770053 RepID=A0A1H2PMC2_9BURK|nr:periplasmic heavy metal sensor [Chitinasiproducens palmae]SDV47731.1 Heavy-metal resistance [Chitinasiproducens palmae]
MSFRQTRLAAVAAALALSIGAAHAAAPAAASDGVPPPPPHAHPAPPPGKGPAPMLRAFEQVHDQLKLDANQEKLYQTARETGRRNHEQMRDAHRADFEKMKAAGQQPILDLRAMRDAREQAFEQARQLHRQTEDAWLQFYDSLNDAQKTTVSSAIKADFAKMRAGRPHGHGPRFDGPHGPRGASAPAAGTANAKP